MATENAIAAVAKIISANKGVAEFPMDQVVPHWIKGLPLLNDDDEAKDTYSLLLELLQSNHAALADQDIIRHLAKVLTQTLTSKVLNNYQDISAGLLDALKHILGSLDSNSKTSIAYGLSEPERQFLASNGLV